MHDDTHVSPSENMYTSCVVACLSASFSSSNYVAPKDMVVSLFGCIESGSSAKYGLFY